MTFPRRFTRLSAAAAMGLALAGAAVGGASSAGSDSPRPSADRPVVCEIAITPARGAVTIEARATSLRPVTGTYALTIARRGGGGSASISQSGEFETVAGEPVTLGSATLGGDPASFRAELELRVNGRRVACAEAEI